MQQKIKKLISYLIIGLISFLISSCEETGIIDYAYTTKGFLNNNSSDSVDIQWYWTNYEEHPTLHQS